MRRLWLHLPLLGAVTLVAGVATLQAQNDADQVVAAPQVEDPREVLDRYPPLTTRPRVPVLEENGYYPCTDCHDNEYQISNPEVRTLEEMHDEIQLVHGAGRFWCLTCHHDIERDSLTTLKGQTVSFDESFLLCGQCHFERQRDFFYGGHGKRLTSWEGDKVVAACTECHDPHVPAIQPAAPYGPPALRKGLVRKETEGHHPQDPWERVRQVRGMESAVEEPEVEAHEAEDPDR